MSRNVDYKARLQHKLYLAREDPEPVFDICDCNLKLVPAGTYSLCKVFRKQALWLHTNKLSTLQGGGNLQDLSLLTVLDLHDNEFTSLPPDIDYLVSLKELYLQNNKLCKLPSELTTLKNLRILNLSWNKLKQLPELMGNLTRLSVLSVSHNVALKKLPVSLGRIRSLRQLDLDGVKLSYPPADVCSGTTGEIVKFLASEGGEEYSPIDDCDDVELTEDQMDFNTTTTELCNENEAALVKLQRLKDERQTALLELERNIKDQKEQELQLQYTHSENKKKLLDDLAQQQTILESELKKVQKAKDESRIRLLSCIHEAEQEADDVIKEFLRGSEEDRHTQAKLVELEQQEEMRLLSASHNEQFVLREKDTLLAMERLLEEEIAKERKLEEYTKFRDDNAQSLLTMERSINKHLCELVENQERSRQELVETLCEDEELQKVMVSALLERSDTRTWSLIQQVNLVQLQLASLTNIELERRKDEMNQQINDVADKRIALSTILLGLLEQQEKRKTELFDTMRCIEDQRDGERNSDNFWLMQYQSLMEARPRGLLETLEPALVRHLAIAGVLHLLPFLATLPSLLPHLDDNRLREIGITLEHDREAVKVAVENYMVEKKLHELEHPPETPDMPSAPVEEACSVSALPSVKSVNEVECVVCMDSECNVIFLPCGHVCCCFKCAKLITEECPMCRGTIERKIRTNK